MTADSKRGEKAITRTKVTILGEEYVLKGDEPEEYILRLAERVDRMMRGIVNAYPNLPRHKAAILTAFYLADEVEKLGREKQEIEELLSELD